ncbi:hypothetical protein GUITHDRAFT_156195 [Guillardia theta CCMP2712]|uniref:Selenoprotein F/M domain-containing protein n=1 Tax=Guillardia theta (strain CCMP2712) TaxID=905079 RepID=L1I9L6_GUITC|nr:hypothetical protein GUITHDRAFT_156195 [Guillardia theta CCMP2712]EKX32946.1 hypothetical protein GUITHDRAFT_156195 [Guillardia theta CCMP2712]|mmetsp:Transcript_26228/g.86257  ORF Transcript_26228/g.86257 Transcript_26228/m.86257 type:complete len:121 (-) Transcript_26228:668-1030(-)|eukprot:XP_005819926.1 hypothetical protein GUITHDRAFT_156195 [Guillardia theta CCMP2712]
MRGEGLALISFLSLILVLCAQVERKRVEVCPNEGCKQAARADLKVCDGICRQYYPQVRKFINDNLKSYPSLGLSLYDDGSLSPSITFFNDKGEEIESVEVAGMYAHEMEEELQSRGILTL